MLKKHRGKIIGLLILAAAVALVILLNGGVQDFHEKYDGEDLTADVSGIGRSDTYEAYLRAHENAGTGDEAIKVDIVSFEGDAVLEKDENGNDCVLTPDGSMTTWKVQVEHAGMYNIMLDYLAVDSRGVDMERELYINGELPFSGAGTLSFSRLWKDAGPVRKDNQGNEIRPSQVEEFDWQQAWCRDAMGYEVDPYQFYFEEGDNTLSLRAVNEPMILRGITLEPVSEQKDYAAYKSALPQVTMSESANKWQTIIEGEDAVLRSSPSLYARYDRSSPATEPYSVTATVLNYIGGDPWNYAGQWIQWDFDVPEDGYYTISIKARQAYQRGALSCRSLYIDGQIPFS